METWGRDRQSLEDEWLKVSPLESNEHQEVLWWWWRHLNKKDGKSLLARKFQRLPGQMGVVPCYLSSETYSATGQFFLRLLWQGSVKHRCLVEQ